MVVIASDTVREEKEVDVAVQHAVRVNMWALVAVTAAATAMLVILAVAK